jgi:hypothetical protein
MKQQNELAPLHGYFDLKGMMRREDKALLVERSSHMKMGGRTGCEEMQTREGRAVSQE